MQGLMARFDVAEYRLCRRLNRGADLWPVRALFVGASRLGDGIVWYALLLALPWMYGVSAVRSALAMAVSALAGLLIYKWLKRTFVRERPFIRHPGISLAAAPLDRSTELLDCYAAGDLFVFASRTETQGLVLPESVDAFVGAITALLADPAERQRLSALARQHAGRWSSAAMAGRLAALYRQLVLR